MTVTVDVDPEAWVLEYGTDATATAVRKEVKEYIGYGVGDMAGIQAAGHVVSWR